MDALSMYEEHGEIGDYEDDELYANPDELLSQMSADQREELLRHYQYYHPDELDNSAALLDEEYGYYDDDEYYDQYSDQYSDYYEDEYSMSIADLLDQCALPTLSQTVNNLYLLLGLCLLTRVTCYVLSEGMRMWGIHCYSSAFYLLNIAHQNTANLVQIPVCDMKVELLFSVLQGARGLGRPLQHIITATCGLISLYTFFEETLTYLVMLALLAYLLLYLMRLKCHGWSGKAVAFITVVYLLTW